MMVSLVLAASSTATMLTTVLNLLGGCTLVFVLGLWITLAIWAWQDSRARFTDRRFQRIFTLLVAFGFLGGLFIYLLLHPRRTFAQEYQQQVEEEALLAELAERHICPTCQTRLTDDFQVCPSCGRVLRRPCPRGPRLLSPQGQNCHRSRSNPRGSSAWCYSFPFTPALDLDWSQHLNRKDRVCEGPLSTHGLQRPAQKRERCVPFSVPGTCETPKNMKHQRSQKT